MSWKLNITTSREKASQNVSKRRAGLFAVIGGVIGGFVGILSSEPLGQRRHGLIGPEFSSQLVAEFIGYLIVPIFLGAAIGWLGARRARKI